MYGSLLPTVKVYQPMDQLLGPSRELPHQPNYSSARMAVCLHLSFDTNGNGPVFEYNIMPTLKKQLSIFYSEMRHSVMKLLHIGIGKLDIVYAR